MFNAAKGGEQVSDKKRRKVTFHENRRMFWIRVLSGFLGAIMILGIVLMVFETSFYSFGLPETKPDDTDDAEELQTPVDKKLDVDKKEISVGLCYGDLAVQSFALASASGFCLQTPSKRLLLELSDVTSVHICVDGRLSFMGNNFVDSDEGVQISSDYHIQISEYAYKTEDSKGDDNPAPINPQPGQTIVTHSGFDSSNIMKYVDELNKSGIFDGTDDMAFAAVSDKKYYIRIGQYDSEDEAGKALDLLREKLIINGAKVISSLDDGYTIVDGSTHRVLCELDVDDNEFELVALRGELSSPDKGNYNGYFSFSYESTNLRIIRVVNKFSIEDYVKAIIRYEVTDDIPLNAAMAVATVLRTNAFNMLGRHKSDGFDVCTDGHCHMYGGITADESGVLAEAVASTKGQVICYNNKPIRALYCLSAGRSTAALPNEVNSDKYPYLSPVSTSWDDRHKWEVSLSSALILSLLESSGYDSLKAPIDSIEVSYPSEGNSQHVNEITLTDVLGNSLTVSGREVIRELFIHYLPSTDFTVSKSNGNDGGVFGDFVFVGYGSGNGIGLSISGAIVLAEQGIDYITIVKKYYTQTEVGY